jgi:hypothetical protein
MSAPGDLGARWLAIIAALIVLAALLGLLFGG